MLHDAAICTKCRERRLYFYSYLCYLCYLCKTALLQNKFAIKYNLIVSIGKYAILQSITTLKMSLESNRIKRSYVFFFEIYKYIGWISYQMRNIEHFNYNLLYYHVKTNKLSKNENAHKIWFNRNFFFIWSKKIELFILICSHFEKKSYRNGKSS